MPKISIIIPVYNTGIKLEKCLNSIINQTKKTDIEILIINDGSTDNSEEIIKQYIEKNNKSNNIKYFSKGNEGIAKTRNFGIEKAISKYIMFLDSDDYLETNAFEILEKYIDKNIDLIKFKLERVNEKDEILEKVSGPVFEVTNGQDAFNRLYCEDVLLDSPCVYLIKKAIFTENNLKFERTYHEDFGLIPFIILSAQTVISIPEYLYKYVQAPNSITRTEDYNKTIKKMEDVLFHYDNMLNMVEKLQLEEVTKENIKIYYTNAIILKLNELNKNSQKLYIRMIKQRKMYKNIKPRDLKQLVKRLLLKYNIRLYLKIHNNGRK